MTAEPIAVVFDREVSGWPGTVIYEVPAELWRDGMSESEADDVALAVTLIYRRRD